jgi:predicted transcriptional regulator
VKKEELAMEEVTTIGQIMAPAQDVINLNEDVRTARRRLQSEAKRSLIVVDGDVPVGVLEWRTIMNDDGDGYDRPVSEVMTQSLPELTSDMTVEDASGRMGDVDCETLPVVDSSGHLIGEVKRSAISKREEVVTEAQMAPSTAETATDTMAPKYSALAKGMTVNGASGSKLGELNELIVGVSGQLEAITVTHGLIRHKNKRVAAELIDVVDDDQVTLVIDQPEFKALPDLEEVAERA